MSNRYNERICSSYLKQTTPQATFRVTFPLKRSFNGKYVILSGMIRSMETEAAKSRLFFPQPATRWWLSRALSPLPCTRLLWSSSAAHTTKRKRNLSPLTLSAVVQFSIETMGVAVCDRDAWLLVLSVSECCIFLSVRDRLQAERWRSIA